jgi:hypothetical protein
MDIVQRAKNIMVAPGTEWAVIDAETTTIGDIYRNYLVYLAAVPAVAGFIGTSLIGQTLPLVGVYRVPVFSGILTALFTYGLSLAGVYILALIIEKLAPTFNGVPNRLAAFKLAAYSVTPAWLAGIFAILPPLSILGVLGLYSLYLFYVGLPVLMRSPPEKAMLYTVAVIIAAVVLNLLIVLVIGLLIGSLMMPG